MKCNWRLEKERGMTGLKEIPRQELWRCMKEKWVSEKHVRLLKDLYEGAYTKVRIAVGLTDSFPMTVGLHQGSSLSPYLFNLFMGVLTESKGGALWQMLFADDIVLIEENKEMFKEKLECWRRAIEKERLKNRHEKVNGFVDTEPFTELELGEAVGRMKIRKAPGIDGVMPETVRLAALRYPQVLRVLMREKER
ncbi:uncharacterized protein [Diabrotica undecimpunctata]|uniref:uncharacterized protein n=1 Tax=Diabrotica undecimpunctata TaxID=50387 RepID=UPI003B63EA8C